MNVEPGTKACRRPGVSQDDAETVTQIAQTRIGHGRSLLLMLLDELDGVGDLDLLGVLVRDLDAELFFEDMISSTRSSESALRSSMNDASA